MQSIRKFRLSSHAEIRMRQRGLNSAVVQLVAYRGDIEVPGFQGRCWVRLSNSAISELASEGESAAVLAQARSTLILIASNGSIVTVVRSAPDRRPRGVRGRYRAL